MSPPGRRSEQEMLAAIRTAAVAELLDVGLGRLSMAGIAERSGAARTSLYRRWESPADVLLDALADDFPQETVTPTDDDLRGDLIAALERLVSWTTTPAAQAVRAILAERDRYPELVRNLYERVFDPSGGRFTRIVLHHYAERGQLNPARVTDVVVDIGEALVFKHLVDFGRPPDRGYLERIVDQAILPAVGL
ncbi:TetR/AcrR family transcriptional regulator [Mycolicibacterium thermoresistibile]